MVKRVCAECDEAFCPYGPDDYICDSCLDAQGIVPCSVCGFDFKPDIDSDDDLCPNCHFDLAVENDLVD